MSTSDQNRERFVRVAEKRVNRILRDLDSLEKCSNRRNYLYTDEDVRRIFSAIERRLREIRSQYQMAGKKDKEFKLKQ